MRESVSSAARPSGAEVTEYPSSTRKSDRTSTQSGSSSTIRTLPRLASILGDVARSVPPQDSRQVQPRALEMGENRYPARAAYRPVHPREWSGWLRLGRDRSRRTVSPARYAVGCGWTLQRARRRPLSAPRLDRANRG